MSYHVKLLLLGSSGVGKTTLLNRWTSSKLLCDPTFAIEVTSHSIKLQEKVIRVRVSDTCGRESYDGIYDGYIYDTDAIVLVYDTSDMDSWFKCKYWMKKIISQDDLDKPIFLIGNKIDRESKRIVYREDVSTYVNNCAMNVVYTAECSARTGENARETYRMILNSLEIPERHVWYERDEQSSLCKIV